LLLGLILYYKFDRYNLRQYFLAETIGINQIKQVNFLDEWREDDFAGDGFLQVYIYEIKNIQKLKCSFFSDYDVVDNVQIESYRKMLTVLTSVDSTDRYFAFNLGDLGLYDFTDEFLDMLRLGDAENIFLRRRFPLLLEAYKDGVYLDPGTFTFDQTTLDIRSVEPMDAESTYRFFMYVIEDFDLLRFVANYPFEEFLDIVDTISTQYGGTSTSTTDGGTKTTTGEFQVLTNGTGVKSPKRVSFWTYRRRLDMLTVANTSVTVLFLRNKALFARMWLW